MTSMSTAIVVVRRGKSPDLFVGEVAQRPEPNETLIANYRIRQDGSELPLGRRVDPARFVGYAQLAKSERVGRLGALTGLSARPIRDFVVASRGPDREGCFEEIGNAIYVPTIGVGRVVTDAGARGSESTNWVQLTLDEEQSDARYVAAYLNTDLGKSARQAQMRGTAHPETQSGLRQGRSPSTCPPSMCSFASSTPRLASLGSKRTCRR